MSYEELGKMVVREYKENNIISEKELLENFISQYKKYQQEASNKFVEDIQKYKNIMANNGPDIFWKNLYNKISELQIENFNIRNLDENQINNLNKLLNEILNNSILSLILINEKDKFLIENQEENQWNNQDLSYGTLQKNEDNDENCVIS